ncbi:kinase-like protein [Stipitochalara longipes BDJ]|nr:kinase-like protein [Stipitochalara longipes BDJ]
MGSELCSLSSYNTGSEGAQPYIYRDIRGSHDHFNDGLRERLCDVMIEAPPGSHRYFIPVDDLDRLLTGDTILKELRDYGYNEEMVQSYSENILKSASRLFATLVYIRHGALILDFLHEGINDLHLPFTRSDMSSKNYKLCSRLRPGQPIKCIERCDRDLVDAFGRDQWYMLAPVFEYHDRVEHYDLHDNCVLPWVEDDERGDHEIQGGFGSVVKVAIHKAHQRFVGNAIQMPLPRFVAIKRLHSGNEEDFRTEVAMLKKLSRRKHAHLVTLLATFRYKGHFYLIFPYAHCNLRQYWQNTPIPDFSRATTLWVLRECRFVASALLMVHESRSTQVFTHESSNLIEMETGSRPDEESRRYGRHGDIKAENILWFEKDDGSPGQLVVADFGLMAFHTKETRSDVDAKYITGSPTYEPPELHLHSKISRAFDIWCLGCLYLEFITWLVCGWRHLQRFPDARDMVSPSAPQYLRDDTFFTIVGGGNQAVVRQAVKDWIADLHEMPRASMFVHDFLNLISDHLLIVFPRDRIKIGQLNMDLMEMVARALKDPSYLTDPRPYPARAQQAEPLSLAAFHWNGRIISPTTEEGVPLPKRLSGILERGP